MGKAEWRGKAIEIVDTGGIIPDDKALIPTEILSRARSGGFEKAALLVLVVGQPKRGLRPLDQELAHNAERGRANRFVIAGE